VEENALTVRMQGSAGDLEPRLRGCGELSVIFHRQGDASYTFRSRVLERRTESEVFLVLAHPDELTRIQKRGFARVEVGARVKFRWIPGRRGAGTVHQGILTDLSANGVGLRTDQCLEPGDLVTLTLDFLPPPAGSQALSAQVVVKRGDGSRGLKFEGLPPQARSEILKFVRSREVEKAAAKRGSGAGSQVASAPETISEREGEVKNVY
jgi:c-di-GMP-binding flagellar brake protein YcgR